MMISFIGYMVIFLVVMFVLARLWAFRKGILTLLVLGGLSYILTNYYLKDKDMSEENVINNANIILDHIDSGLKKYDDWKAKMDANVTSGMTKKDLENYKRNQKLRKEAEAKRIADAKAEAEMGFPGGEIIRVDTSWNKYDIQ